MSNPSPQSVAPTAEQAEVDQLVALFHAGLYPELESKARALSERQSNHGFAWKALGIALTAQGKNALAALQNAANCLPDDAEAHSNLGNALIAVNQLDAAVTSFRRALVITPNFAEAHNNLGNALIELRQFDAAVECYRKAVMIKPGFAEAHCNLGNALRELGQRNAAAASQGRAVEIRPNFAEAHNSLGITLIELGQADEAVVSFRQALSIKPNYPKALNNLGNALTELGNSNEAVASLNQALTIEPEYAEAHSNLGNALQLQGRTSGAEACWRRALDIKPDFAGAMVSMAGLLVDTGKFAEAEDLYRRAIASEPKNPEAWAGITRCRKMTRTDAPWLEAALELVGKFLPPRKESVLRFAIGKYCDDVKDYEQAFPQYRRGNELSKRVGSNYDGRRHAETIERLICDFNRDWINRARADASLSARPIFICGMPRSGTSLAEQILASHPAVFGAGEVAFWQTYSTADNLTALTGASGDQMLQKLADDYLELLADYSSGALHVVDKMPANFMYLGIIRAALPNAKIIHMRRNPVDTCLSIYFQSFGSAHSYANNLEDLAHYYREYRRIVEHWQATLPPGAILHLPYEGLINDQEDWSRKMLEFIGLPWDERCIDFHLTERKVGTASNWQVRQKIGKTSVERWRNYEKFVGPLMGLLD